MTVAIPSAAVVQAEDSPQLQEVAQAVRDHAIVSAHLTLDDGRSIAIPPVVAQALAPLVAYLAAGDDVTMTPFARDYTIAEAAEFLDAAPQYVSRMLDDGELPFTLVGTQRRIAFPALVAHVAKMRERMAEGVRVIQRLSEEEGAYDE